MAVAVVAGVAHYSLPHTRPHTHTPSSGSICTHTLSLLRTLSRSLSLSVPGHAFSRHSLISTCRTVSHFSLLAYICAPPACPLLSHTLVTCTLLSPLRVSKVFEGCGTYTTRTQSPNSNAFASSTTSAAPSTPRAPCTAPYICEGWAIRRILYANTPAHAHT